MAGSAASPELLSTLHNKATQLRINSVRATSEAGSGHPSSCCFRCRHRRRIVFFRHALRSPESQSAQQRSLYPFKRTCGSAALCGVGGSGALSDRAIS